MLRDILHFSIPDFPVAVTRVIDPSLAQRPLALAPGHSGRALLQAVSAEARDEGVREGMPVYRAQRLCPALRVLPPDPLRLHRAAQAVLKLACGYSPLWEPASPGCLYLDLTGSSRLLGPGRDVASRLEKDARKMLRLSGAVGVAANKLVSRIASGYLERPGVCDVLRGSEGSFIAPLPLAVLPGVGRARAGALFNELNLHRVEELAALTLAQLRLAVGGFAPLLQQRARGVDPSPVQVPTRRPKVAEEALLSAEENDDTVLTAELCRLVEGCGFALRRQGRGARHLTLALHYADGASERRSSRLPAAEDRDEVLLGAAEELFAAACQRRVRVKGMCLEVAELAAPDRQLGLFDAPAAPSGQRRDALQQALDTLRGRHGMDAVLRGKSLAAGR